MILEQYYLNCLSHASYLIGDDGTRQAVVVDPQRDVSIYCDDLRKHGLQLQRVIETHFHADFVSGHLELAAQTGAAICYGEPARADFPIQLLHDGEEIPLGDVVLRVLATPGHTPESISIVVYEHAGDPQPHAVLTGDTLFVGDVGRPDLLAAGGVSQDDLARRLYRSLHEKLLPLPDSTRVYPAHGAGSACGKSLSTATWSTIGDQRRTNYALRPMTEDRFVALVTEGQPVAPAYFPFSAQRNHERRALLDDHPVPRLLEVEEVLRLQSSGAVVLDTRSPADFAAGHLRGAVNVGLEGRFAEYAGDVLGPEQQVVLCCAHGTAVESQVRLARIGFDNVVGAVADPVRVMLEHPELVVQSSRVTAAEMARLMETVDGLTIVDVRNPGELERGVIPGAVHIPMPTLRERMHELNPAVPTIVHCASGYRSSIAASVLAAAGFADVSDLLGGFDAWESQAAA